MRQVSSFPGTKFSQTCKLSFHSTKVRERYMFNALATTYTLYRSSARDKPSMQGINEVISRIKFISMLPAGEKLSITRLESQRNSWLTTFMRTFNSRESRWDTLKFIENTVEEGFRIIDICRKSDDESDNKLAQEIMDDLKAAALGGIRNCQTTYESDPKFCCDIEVLTKGILRRIEYLSNDKSKSR